MSGIILSLLRQMIGRWGLLWWGLALVVMLRLHFDPTLGHAHLGGYLASVALGPTALLIRLGLVLQRRRDQGWPLEEALRDRTGWRAPTAEAASTTLLILGWLLLAGIGPWMPGLARPESGQELFPVQAAAAPTAGVWQVDLEGQAPEGAELLLTLDWQGADEALRQAGRTTFEHPDGRRLEAVAGELLRWPLTAEEGAAGEALLPPLPPGVQLIRPLTRLAAPRPGLAGLPRLLIAQALFFLPLVGLLLAWARAGVISGPLASWATLALAGLVAMPPSDLALPQDALGLVAQALLLVKSALPAVDGLLANGDAFARHLGTTHPLSLIAWWALGLGGLVLACRRRRSLRDIAG
jgi:hypothetical protein